MFVMMMERESVSVWDCRRNPGCFSRMKKDREKKFFSVTIEYSGLVYDEKGKITKLCPRIKMESEWKMVKNGEREKM